MSGDNDVVVFNNGDRVTCMYADDYAGRLTPGKLYEAKGTRYHTDTDGNAVLQVKIKDDQGESQWLPYDRFAL